MSKAIKEQIRQLLEESTQFNANDVLVNIDRNSVLNLDQNKLDQFDIEQTECKSILKKAQENERETGVNPLCIAEGMIEWEIKQTVVNTPLLLIPCQAKLKKIDHSVHFEIDRELSFINPFLLLRIKRDFDIQLPDTNDLAEIQSFIEANSLGKCHINQRFIGNFHHHRFELIKELEELLVQSTAPALAQLLGDESSIQRPKIELTKQLLFPSDPDQDAVFESFLTDNTVVQGPPGTGKSQVLSNLIAKLVHDGYSAVVISEKRVALEVLKKKLNEFQLADICFIATSETITKDFLSELKESWSKLEKQTVVKGKNLLLSEQYIDKLQLQLNLLNDSSLFGGVGYSVFRQLTEKKDLNKAEYRSDLPNTAEWLAVNETVKLIFQKEIHVSLGYLSPVVLKNEHFFQIDRKIGQMLKEFNELQKLFTLDNWHDLQRAMKKAALCQLFDSTDFRRYEAILTPASKEQKKFIKLYKKYLQLKAGLAPFENEKQNWIIEPSLTETEGLLQELNDASYIGKWRFKKHWKKTARVPENLAETALHKWKQYLTHLNSISQIEIDFCEIGVLDPTSSVEQLYVQLHSFKGDEYNEWAQIAPEERTRLAASNSQLNSLYHEIKTYFRPKEHLDLSKFLPHFLLDYQAITELRESLLLVPDIVLRNLSEFSNFESMHLAVLKANQVRLNSHFPSLADFQPEALLTQTHRIIEEQKEEAETFARCIRDRQVERFQEYHHLLRTPSTKLTPTEKELKTRLKKGKALLVKEFGKTRSFPSMRELFASEARIWIQLLKPVWLSNPSQLAKCFPMESGLFDAAIFDEASQLPLANTLGAIQRSNCFLIAGDSQQMGPSTYFQTKSADSVDILHQASFYWKNKSLKHHYRSEHPGLISFSNHHFYQGKLQAYPSVKQEKQAIEWHFCEKGRYDDRRNELEAKAVAQHIEKLIDHKDSLGIVAFSEAQLDTIYQALSSKCKIKLEERIEQNSVFFKALENVQGEECDRMIISLGYGRNSDDEFHMRFGPINSKNGSKRLNVLFTRARRKIDFFSSVKGEDFQISSNEAVDLLRQYLMQLESESLIANTGFPSDLFPTVESNQLLFHSLHSQIKGAKELVTLVRVLEKRGWEIGLR